MKHSRTKTVCFVAILFGLNTRAFAQDCLWTNETPLPGERISSLVVFDSNRGVSTFVAANGLWSWDGFEWSFEPVVFPTVGGESHVAYDDARQVIVLHGKGKTWESSGGPWVLRSETGPGTRTGFRIVYDSARQVTVLHGGKNNSGYLNDTWEWEGSTWIQRSTNGPFRGFYIATFDSSRQRMVLFGGLDQDFQSHRELWDWDGANWTQLSGDLAITASEIEFDTAQGVLLLSFSSDGWQDMWEWDGIGLSQIPVHGPLARSSFGFVHDSVRQRTILYGGSNHRDHWEWNGTGWTLFGGLTPSSANYLYNSKAGQVQGISLCCGNSQIWTYESPDWSMEQTAGPPTREGHAIAYDEARNKAVLFGGRDRSTDPDTPLNDTWEWDGASWTQIFVPGPPPRSGHTMTYDSDRGVVVMFGGYIATDNDWDWQEFGDTWEWDGTIWTQRTSSGPSPRYWHAMTYDSDRAVVVLYGGTFYHPLGGSGYGDLWEWNGLDWTLRSMPGPNKPGWGYNFSIVYDEARHVSVLTSGGWGSDFGGAAYTSTWEWNGSDWALRQESDSPRGPAVYDAQRQRTVLLDGPDVWEYPLVAIPASAPLAEQVPQGAGSISAIKNRYLSFVSPSIPESATTLAFRVTATQLPGPSDCPNVGDFSDRFQTEMWVGDEVLSGGGAPTGLYKLSDAPVFRYWSTVSGGLIHVSDCNIIPCATYAIEAVSDTPCNVGEPVLYSEPTLIATSSIWADIVANDGSPLPDGVVDFVDVSGCVDRFRNSPTSPPRTWCDIGSDSPNQGVVFNIDFSDISLVVDAFRGRPYPFPGPTAPIPCP